VSAFPGQVETMDAEEQRHNLNPSQRRHLLTSCQYADKLLSEIESVLAASQSKSPFPRFKPDISPGQAKVVQDYISRMRAQLLRILASHGIPIPPAMFGSAHSIRVTLGFVDIAFDEVRPKRMLGYGALPPAAGTQLSGLVDEMHGIAARLAAYLAQGDAGGLAERLAHLQQAGTDIALVKALERAIGRQGLVEFRPALEHVVERFEGDTFEIAVFGRVSSGKSSLLNHIVGRDVLPVGVTPVTAVPTRLAYGSEPRATVWFADRKPERCAVERLADFVTEQCNPANREHVTRIVVELPSERLREGIVYVDTPGLGSLATGGAAEAKAYLPRCDLGVALIDAGAALTEDDLATIQALFDAGTPASVLLSKADLLTPEDRQRATHYAVEHIESDLGLSLPVHPVSIKAGYAGLVEDWLGREILPLYGRRAELSRQSLSRKIGALRLGVEAALKARLERSEHPLGTAPAGYAGLETELRKAAGRIVEAREECTKLAEGLLSCDDALMRSAAEAIAAAWKSDPVSAKDAGLLKAKLEAAAAEKSARIPALVEEAALKAASALERTAKALGAENRPDEDELLDVLKDLPRFDIGSLEARIAPSPIGALLGGRWARRGAERRIQKTAGRRIAAAAASHARVTEAWVRRAFTDLQRRFESYADPYRAQLARLISGKALASEERQSLTEDLAALAGTRASRPEPAEAPHAAV
jgi:GTP-binding protein EngB required for normal cell division